MSRKILNQGIIIIGIMAFSFMAISCVTTTTNTTGTTTSTSTTSGGRTAEPQLTITAENYPPAFDTMLRSAVHSQSMFNISRDRYINDGRLSREEATWINYVYFLENIATKPNYAVQTRTRENIDGTSTITRNIDLLPSYRFSSDMVIRTNTSLSINQTVTGSNVEHFFMFSYSGSSWRFYTGITLNVDGAIYRIPMLTSRDTTRNGVIEVGAITISSELLNVLKNASEIRYQMSADRINDSIHVLPEDAITAIRNFL